MRRIEALTVMPLALVAVAESDGVMNEFKNSKWEG
jgi:hypothetical protein